MCVRVCVNVSVRVYVCVYMYVHTPHQLNLPRAEAKLPRVYCIERSWSLSEGYNKANQGYGRAGVRTGYNQEPQLH